MRGFRDEALSRVTAVPPDPCFDRPDRLAWRASLARVASDLDRLAARGHETRPWGRVLQAAFRVFLPLADPQWWRAHPAVRLNAGKRRQLRWLGKHRRRAARRPWSRGRSGELGLRVCDAIAVYLRRGDGEGVERCLRVIDEITVLPASAGVAGDRQQAPGRGGRRPARGGPGGRQPVAAPPGGSGGRPAAATTPGPESPGSGKEDV